MHTRLLAIVCFISSVVSVAAARADFADSQPVRLDEQLARGELRQAADRLADALKRNPTDDTARYELGLVQVIQAVERLAQSLYRHGLSAERVGVLAMLGVPLAQLPLKNPNPQTISYEQFRAIVGRWIEDCDAAQATFAQVGREDVRVRLRVGLIRIDITGDGRCDDVETFWSVYSSLTSQRLRASDAEAFEICFDRSDVDWFRAYLHLLMAGGQMFLAYDTRELFERCGHLLFKRPKTPYDFLDDPGDEAWSFHSIVDLIAFIHLVNFPLAEESRMKVALGHLQSTIARSREMWRRIQAETDDDKEWIPSPTQTGVIPGVRITPEMVRSWPMFLDEATDLLEGRKLAPFWRNSKKGVNLRRIFTEPRAFDLVLWVQGTAAAPYLEDGPVTSEQTWQEFQRVFNGQFLSFAAWIN